ncbi:MAG: ABC transporter substrate-binding protein [Deltaproteobacteria bacterium]|nr:ABC transporter substrate-binding protein [Deltaproteobacteria bacterium]
MTRHVFSKFRFYIPVQQKHIACLAIVLFVITASLKTGYCYPVNFRDSSGRDISITEEPASVISLVPSITEIIARLGASEKIKAKTVHDTFLDKSACVETVGGFINPDLERVARLNPDVIFYSGIQKGVLERFSKGNAILINLETGTIEEGFRHIELIGEIFHKKREAEGIIRENKSYLDIISKKSGRIPAQKRKRVMRIMGGTTLMTPGDNSFQTELITLAGGIPPVMHRNGHAIPIDKEAIKAFRPHLIYGCENDRKLMSQLVSDPELKDVDAIKNYDVHYYPCELTCRVSANTGYFVEWLSADIYREEYAKKENFILAERVFNSKKLDIDLNYVNDFRIDTSNLYDFTNKTLIIKFKTPISVLSTLEGARKNIKMVGNHYAPLSCWSVADNDGLKGMREKVLRVLGKSEAETSFLFTGADVDNVAVIKETYREMSVYAVITAGVKSNAMRMSVDEGGYYEPGTINILLLPNMKLTERAMAGVIITATEAKSAALQDLDIRSSYSPAFQATGTGTDNIIVVQGSGERSLDTAGGHTKLGELMAKAVYKGVREAVHKQNGIRAERDIFARLRDRRININEEMLAGKDYRMEKREIANNLERLLLEPEYAAFIASSFSISDDYERGMIKELVQFEKWCIALASDISGNELSEIDNYTADDNVPMVIKLALNTLITGICAGETKD